MKRLNFINSLLGNRPFNRLFWALGLIAQAIFYAVSFPRMIAASSGVRNPVFFLAGAFGIALLLWGLGLYFDEAKHIHAPRKYFLVIVCVGWALISIRVNLYVW